MQKWEYLQLSWMYEHEQRRFAMNGQFKHEWNGQALHHILNVLGEDGWELVDYEVPAKEILFKRPKSA